MRSLFEISGLVGVGLSLALLDGCSNVPATPTAPVPVSPASNGAPNFGVQRSIRPRLSISGFAHDPGFGQPSGTAIVVSDSANGVVRCYDAAGNETAELTGFNEPSGVASDAGGSLYIADDENARIVVYSGGCSGTPKAYADPNQYPYGVAVDGRGNLAVTSLGSTPTGRGSVAFYDSQGNLTKTLTSSSIDVMLYAAFDAAGNLFVDGLRDAAPHLKTVVGEVVGGAAGSSITVLSTRNKIEYPGGIAVGELGRINIADGMANKIYRYAPPVGDSLGAPLITIKFKDGGREPTQFAFASANRTFWVVDTYVSSINEFAVPQGGSPLQTIPVPPSGLTALNGVTVIPAIRS